MQKVFREFSLSLTLSLTSCLKSQVLGICGHLHEKVQTSYTEARVCSGIMIMVSSVGPKRQHPSKVKQVILSFDMASASQELNQMLNTFI